LGSPPPPTPSQTVGPFFGFALPFPGDAEASTLAGGAVRIEGQVLDGEGEPVADALLEAWQDDQFARCRSDAEGAFHFLVRKPSPPASDGRRHAPHLELTVFARGLLRHLATRIYFPDEAAANEADPVLALVEPDRRGTLVARAEGGVLHFDVRLQGAGETVFFAI
jgi:protocatechuate 3,4-dioxygenase, alpha subunit